jgi:hypothetical protein
MPYSIPLPRSRADLEALIAAGTPESLHLDYKESASLELATNHKELSKDASAFLNSDGGLLVYGIRETGHLPVALDSGVAHAAFTRERLEQLIISNISPRPPGIGIVQVSLSATHSAYAVAVPRGLEPYQDARTNKYYKRFNFQSVPMEHYEIEDLRNRRSTLERLVNVEIEIRHGFMVYIVVSNPGTIAAQDVRIHPRPDFPWADGAPPPLIADGARVLPPGRRYYFFYDSFLILMGPESKRPNAFAVDVGYAHPSSDTRIEESFDFNLKDYERSAIIYSDLTDAGTKLADLLKEIHSDLGKINANLESLGHVASPTGLNLSVTALQNLARLDKGDAGFRLPPSLSVDLGSVMEALGVEYEIGYRIREFLWGHGPATLQEIPGMTAELAERVTAMFPKRIGA